MSMIPPIRCIGPETLDAVAKCDPRTLVTDLSERQAAYYRSLADFPIFGTVGSTVPRRGAAQCSARDDCGRGIKISAVLTHFATMCVLYFRQLGAIVPPLISSVIS
jgi:hypothetical protein